MRSAPSLGALTPKAPTSDARSRLERFLRRSDGPLAGSPDRVRVEPLVKEAGERVYFRIGPRSPVDREADTGGGTLVLCVMAEPYEPGLCRSRIPRCCTANSAFGRRGFWKKSRNSD